MKTNAYAALVLATAALAGCGDHRMINSAMCADFKSTSAGKVNAPLPTSDAAGPVDDCLRRWAYSLAGSRDEADTVADATVAACSAQLSHWGQATVGARSGEQGDAGADGVSLTTGQPTNPLAEHATFARGRAVLYVVQARAGRCAPPAVVNGAPAADS
jgi:hypothetical protein